MGGAIIPPGHVSTGPGDPTIYNPFNFTLNGGDAAGDAPPVRVWNRYQNYPRLSTNDTNFIRLLGGLRSQISKDYSFETAYYYSSYRIAFVGANLVIVNQLNAMIAGTARDANGNLIPSFDFFALNPIGTGPGQVSAAQFATIFGQNIRSQETFQKVFDAKLTGFPIKLPAGPLGFALGGEYRTEGYSVKDSPEIFVDSIPVKESSLSRGIYAVFLELSFPLVSPPMKIPGIYSLDLTLAGRHEHYDGLSEDANVPKVTLRYQPIPDLTLRASFSNSFVAPDLYELHGPSSIGVSNTLTLPAFPGDSTGKPGQANALFGSNAKLLPTTAQNYGFGAIYSPKWARGLTMSADYFNVLQQNVVSTLGDYVILPSVNQFGPASPYYGLVHVGSFRGRLISPTSGPLGNGTYFIANNFVSVYYIDTNINVGSIRATGWDFSISYTWDLKRYGTLQFGANAVLFVNYDQRQFSYSPYQNLKGPDFPEGGGNNPAYRVNMLAEYRYRGWTLGFTGNYTPPVYNLVSVFSNLDPNFKNEAQKIPDHLQIDSRLSYNFGAAKAVPISRTVVDPTGGPVRTPVDTQIHWYHGLTLTVGCNNMFNQQPPFIAGATSNTDLSAYDPYGRMVYFLASKKF